MQSVPLIRAVRFLECPLIWDCTVLFWLFLFYRRITLRRSMDLTRQCIKQNKSSSTVKMVLVYPCSYSQRRSVYFYSFNNSTPVIWLVGLYQVACTFNEEVQLFLIRLFSHFQPLIPLTNIIIQTMWTVFSFLPNIVYKKSWTFSNLSSAFW